MSLGCREEVTLVVGRKRVKSGVRLGLNAIWAWQRAREQGREKWRERERERELARQIKGTEAT